MAYKKKPLIGFVGQGYVGKNYADDFEKRGYEVIRYSLEEPYIKNKSKIKNCDVVIVAVPTPSTPQGFDGSIVRAALSLVGKGKIALIKSTIVPGMTRELQKKYPQITVLFCPEFLSVATAAYDVANPIMNVVGVASEDAQKQKDAHYALSLFKRAPLNQVCTSEEAELIKYAHNISGYMQILTFNTVYDIAEKLGASWSPIQRAIETDPLISNRYSNPVHKGGRGAGGFCFIKDMAAFTRHYEKVVKEPLGTAMLRAAQKKNIALLLASDKDLDLLTGVYGPSVVKSAKKRAAKK
ncbi:MAG: UDP-glucose/GDP-mannose dehydrogenase family protein [Candidatus Kaiserbacteria bacterium]|nr:UDP-glucose/GDP-mannose dehydrogenase family protein [Candidatus Kaiserbacteria bacterium]